MNLGKNLYKAVILKFNYKIPKYLVDYYFYVKMVYRYNILVSNLCQSNSQSHKVVSLTKLRSLSIITVTYPQLKNQYPLHVTLLIALHKTWSGTFETAKDNIDPRNVRKIYVRKINQLNSTIIKHEHPLYGGRNITL